MVRAIVTSDGNLDHKAFVPYDKLFETGKAGEVVVGTVTSVEDGVVHLESGVDLSYDWLVLATGSSFAGPFAFPNDILKKDEFIKEWQTKFAQAKDIVLLGGGAAGYEVAGELRYYNPGSNVTVIHGLDLPFNPAYPDKFRKYAAKRLRETGVNLILGDRATYPSAPFTSITTEKGVTVKADLVVPMWGGHVNTEFLRSFDPTILTSKGTITVLPSLRVPLQSGKTNVFAIGDVIEWTEQKNLAKIPAMAAVLVPNILAAIEGKPAPKVYKGFMDAIVLPLGPKGGVGFLPLLWGIILGNFFAWLLKSRTLFVDQGRAALNYT